MKLYKKGYGLNLLRKSIIAMLEKRLKKRNSKKLEKESNTLFSAKSFFAKELPKA